MENSRMSPISGSMIGYFSALVKAHGGYNFAQGIPGFDPPEALLMQLAESNSRNAHQYPPGNGNPDLIRELIRLYEAKTSLNPDEMTIVQGATEGIHLAYLYVKSLKKKRLNVLAFDPVYESYAKLPKIYGDTLFTIPIQEHGSFNWDEIDGLLSGSGIDLVIINSPGNPLGRVWTESELRRMDARAQEHHFHIIFDGVYLDCYFGERIPYDPIALRSSRFLYVSSFSKMLSITGWRIGYLISSTDSMQKIRDIHDYTGLCAPSLMQMAIAGFLKQPGALNSYLTALRQQLKDGAVRFTQTLTKFGFQFAPPEAGYFIWARLPSGYPDGLDFCLKLYTEQKVALVPGIHFSPQGASWVRINFARKPEELEPGIQGLEDFLNA